MKMESELAVWHEVRERFGGESLSSPNEVKCPELWNDDGGHAQRNFNLHLTKIYQSLIHRIPELTLLHCTT